ncbi:zinc knuckle [Purpureocillium lavendulum]|uniref:Zinc knuckle n=1 Tax=Purpureocillium lavendulum TaxID=1247861 RepID=A0AB34FG15_9HYPO|nr:zinc knuckle [Purpureocillium lavendulum]
MATPWPEDQTWPADYREHATKLSTYLQAALKSINADGPPIDPLKVRHSILGTLSLIVKLQGAADLGRVRDAIRDIQTEAKAAVEKTNKAIYDIRDELKNTNRMTQQTIASIQENANTAMAATAAAKEAMEVGKATMKMVQGLKPTGAPTQNTFAHTYATIAARGGLAASMHNPVNHRTTPVQAQREIIVNIRDPVTIASIRAMNPRNLKAHIDRAIEQSSNEHINKIKVASSNQLKSGDLSIKTTTSADMEALRQFAEDWEQRIGNGATVRILTYGVLAHGIRTSSMDMTHFDELRDELLQDNKPFIPNAEIKYIGWLTKSSSSKSSSSVIVEFAKAEDANRIIDEGLIWQGEVFQCERYDRQCRLRQCFRCHKYGHIGTQCRATTACGYCAQDHPTRECPAKNDDMAPRKCAACRGEHEAWNSQCPTRKQELAKIKDAYKARPKYHPENPMPLVPAAGDSLNRTKETTRPGRPTLEPRQSQGTRPSRSRSPTKKIQKRQIPTSSQSHNENANLNINNATDPADAEKARPKRAYNVRKSKDTVMATLLRDPRIREYDILAIQEPWKNAFSETTHHPAKDLFHLCYPATKEGEPTRVCFFINKQLDHSKWHFKNAGKDLCTLILETNAEGNSKIAIHNVYNPHRQQENRRSILPQLRREMQGLRQGEQIVVGDFNLHHERWGGSRVRRADDEADELLEIMDDFSLTSHLPAGTITFEEADRQSTIDLSLSTIGLVDRLTKCGIDEDINHDSDHLPIVTSLDITTTQLQPKSRLKWKAIDKAAFSKTLRQQLPSIRRPRTKAALNSYVAEITTALMAAIEAGVPQSILTPRSKAAATTQWKAGKHTARQGIERRDSSAKRYDKTHREKVEQAAESPELLWRIAKWARNRQCQTSAITPALKDPATLETAITPGEKAELFRKAFFPKPPEANLEDIDNAVYADPINLPQIAEQEVEDAIRNAAPLKAPGPDGIVNRALQIASPWIRQHLTRIFNQSLSLGYCPQHFRNSTTIVI